MKKLASLLFAICFIVTASTAQQLTLSPLESPKGARFTDFIANHQGQILAYQELKGLFFSNDSGETWEQVNHNNRFYDLKADSKGNFYILESSRLLRFNDVDKSFDYIFVGSQFINDFTIDEFGRVFIIDGNNGIYRSDTLGTNWTKIIDNGISNYGRQGGAFAPEGEDFIYANLYSTIFQSGLYKIAKDGSSQQYMHEFGGVATDVVKHPSGDIIIYGINRTTSKKNLFVTIDGYTQKALHEKSFWRIIGIGTDEIFGINSSGFYSSSDLGENWELLNSLNFERIGETKKIIYSQKDNSFFTLNNGGGSFNFYIQNHDFSSYEPLSVEDNLPSVSDIIFSTENKALIRVKQSLYQTDTYFNYSIPCDWYQMGTSQTPKKILIDNRLGIKYLDTISNDGLLAIAENDSIYRSLDFGDTWELFHNVPHQEFIHFGFLNFLKSSAGGVIFFGQNGIDPALYVSKNEGETWELLDTTIIQMDYLISNSKGEIFSLLGNDINVPKQYFCRWNESSRQWDTLYSSSSDMRFHITTTDQVLLFESDKGGTRYIQFDSSGNHITSSIAQISSRNRMYSFKNGYLLQSNLGQNILISKNLGRSWDTLYVNPNEDIPISALAVDNDNRIWVGFGGKSIHFSQPLVFQDKFIFGKVFIDENENCLFDSSEMVFPDQIIQATNQNTFYTKTDSKGEFFMPIQTGDYDVSVPINRTLWTPCDSVISLSFSNAADSIYVEFPLKRKQDCMELNVHMVTPYLRFCTPNNYYVFYSNTGSKGADSAHVEISLDPRFTITSSNLNFQDLGGGLYRFDLGKIGIFDSGRFYFETEMDCNLVDLEETVCAEANIFPQQICQDTSALWSGASLTVNGTCDGDSIRFKIKNVGTGDMIQAKNHIIIEDVAIMRIGNPVQLGAGEEFEVDPMHAVGQTVHVGISQPDGHPLSSTVGFTIEGCGEHPYTYGLFNQIGQSDDEPFVDIECKEITSTLSMNGKSAVPSGWDVDHKIQPDRYIEYQIMFHNNFADTVFNVRIQDSISQWLDLTTLQPVTSSHPYKYEVTGQGVVTFIFDDINLVDNPIPVPASIGFIKYKIAMKSGLAPGTEIFNDADIFFDSNVPVRTNQTFHTINGSWALVKTGEVYLPKSEVKIYPNPFRETAILELKADNFLSEFNCQILDINGKMISTQISKNQQIQLYRNNLNSGIYFYQLFGDSGKIASGKIVIK